jgi:hypothetical protein
MVASMRAGRLAVTLLALAVFACLAGSAGAEAKGRPAVERWIDMDLQGSGGYSVHISVGPLRHLTMRVSKDDFSATYITRDELAATDRVKAQLRDLGTVSVRFHPKGPLRHPALPGCEKRPPTVQPGVVRGTIRFAGEGDYVEVEADEAKASIEEVKNRSCRYGDGESSEFDPRERDWVSKFTVGGDGVFFLARRYLSGTFATGDVLYFAETGELFKKEPGLPYLLVYRELKVPAPVSTFQDAHFEHLTISPPPPFSGTGRLVRTPESVFAWRGDLALQFPGLDPIHLAGPGFEPEYCLRESGCVEQNFG